LNQGLLNANYVNLTLIPTEKLRNALLNLLCDVLEEMTAFATPSSLPDSKLLQYAG